MTEEQLAAIRRAQQGLAAQRALGAVSSTNEGRVIATTDDGGRVVEQQDGSRSFTSPGYSTNDAAAIERIMQGATPADVVQTSIDEQRIAQNPIAARANELVRGTPAIGSYADDAVGLVSPDAAENMRATTEAMERTRPGQTTALNLTGAIAGAVPLAVAAGPTLAANASQSLGVRAVQGGVAGAAAGATEGAIYGAGEGTDQETRLAEAGQGAAWGGAAGAALGPIAVYGAEALKRSLAALKGSDVSVIAAQLGLTKGAARVVRNALEAGGVDDAVAALQRGGDDAMLADANQATQGLLDTAVQTGGPAGQIARGAIDERVSGATAQMNDALDRALGSPQGQNALADGVRASTAASRSATYDAAYATAIDYSTDQGRRLESLLTRVPESAIRRAQQIMDVSEETSSQIMARIGDDGRVAYETMPDVKQVHYIMQALDDVANATDGQGVLGRQTTYGGRIQNLRNLLGRTMRDAVPEFGQAQDIAADTARRLQMTETGRNLLLARTTREEVSDALSSATGAEREAMRQGVRSYIDDVTANVARTMTDGNTDAREGIRILRDFSSRANQTKLRTLLGRSHADTLLAEIDQAATAFELRAAIAQNSKTAVRQATQGSVSDLAQGGVVQALMDGEPVNATKRMVQAMTGGGAEARALREMGLYEEIARTLTSTRGDRAQAAMRLIERAMNGQELSEAQARVVSNAVANSLSLAANHELTRTLSE